MIKILIMFLFVSDLSNSLRDTARSLSPAASYSYDSSRDVSPIFYSTNSPVSLSPRDSSPVGPSAFYDGASAAISPIVQSNNMNYLNTSYPASTSAMAPAQTKGRKKRGNIRDFNFLIHGKSML